MSRYLPVCDGVISISSSFVQCTGGLGWQSIDATYLPGQFDISMLDAVVLSQYFAAGFFMCASVLAVCFGVGMILKSIAVL
jgi:hypothetical protein